MEREPSEDEILQVERQRIALSAEFEVLEECLRRAIAADGSSSIIGVPGITEQYDNSADDFNDLDDETPQAVTIPHETSEVTAESAITLPSSDGLKCITHESRAIILPSTCLSSDHSLSLLELTHRQRQANRYIIALQNVIAEKSFQFSNIIRAAPRKSVITRARNAVAKLNAKITFFAKIYCRSRAAIEQLTDDHIILRRFRILTKQDLRASGAIKDPNTPGLSNVQLSWIWQMSDADNDSPAHIRECMYGLVFQY